MDYQYKVIISNRTVYKEFEIPTDMEGVRLGTTSFCEFRLNPESFFGDIEIEFTELDNKWNIDCSDNVYFSRGDMRKLYSTEIKHGDIISVCYTNTGNEAFELRFMIDFDAKVPKVQIPLPHLVIVVDEFAELKAEQPEFMKELISAARIGRSLGIHLILATQKPAGQVNEQIWSNSKFKLCLKVQNQEDSKEVLKSPLAAEIREPGRAYLQVGNNEIFELFQSAFSGAPAVVSDDNLQKKFKILQCNFNGRRSVVYEKKNSNEKKSTETELDAIVKYIHDYCEKEKIQKLPNICLHK